MEDTTKAVESALRLLSYRPRAEEEMRRRLARRFPSAVVDGALAVLKKQGMLDDVAFAHFWREARQQHRPRGIAALHWELRRLGVDREVAQDALQDLQEEEEAARAVTMILPRLERADWPTFLRKVSSYLRRRGFRGDVVMGTVRRTWEQLSNPVHGDEEGNGEEQ